MGACSSYLYKLLQGLPVQACVVLQELDLLQLELVPKVGLCLLLQQLEHHSAQEEVKEIPQYQQRSPADLLVVNGEEGHAAALLLPVPAQYLISYCPKTCATQDTQESQPHVLSYCPGEFFNRTYGYHQAYTK